MWLTFLETTSTSWHYHCLLFCHHTLGSLQRTLQNYRYFLYVIKSCIFIIINFYKRQVWTACLSWQGEHGPEFTRFLQRRNKEVHWRDQTVRLWIFNNRTLNYFILFCIHRFIDFVLEMEVNLQYCIVAYKIHYMSVLMIEPSDWSSCDSSVPIVLYLWAHEGTGPVSQGIRCAHSESLVWTERWD